MVARLWWKDLRQFWPIWALLALVGLVAQWIAVHYFREHSRSGELAAFALGWTSLYAFLVAAAAFAGERETRTLQLLDALPVERWRVWTAKSSFALLSTAALGLLLLAIATLGTDRWWVVTPGSPGWGILFGSVVILLIFLSCGLFWSAATSHALLAAVLAIASALSIIPILDWISPYGSSPILSPLVLMVAALALVASWLLFVASGPPRRTLLNPVLRLWPTRPALETSIHSSPAASRMSFWAPASRSLVWQTMREVRSKWWLVLIGLGVPALATVPLGWNNSVEMAPLYLCLFSAVLIAGVSVFGMATSTRTQVFLAHHGTGAGVVWTTKVVIWAATILLVLGLAAGIRLVLPIGTGLNDRVLLMLLYYFASALLLMFALAVLCGMVFRRGITAGSITILLWILLMVIGGGLYRMDLLPWRFAFLTPLVILAVTSAWCGDWMLDRPGAWRWVKLALLLVGAFTALFAGYTADRAWGVPTLDPAEQSRIFAFKTPAPVAAGGEATDLYRQAMRAISPAPPEVSNERSPKGKEATAWLQRNSKSLELLRKASILPGRLVSSVDRETLFSGDPDLAASNNEAYELLAMSVSDRQSKGDLDGAWEDLMVMFRLARRGLGPVTIWRAMTALTIETQALNLAMVWAADERLATESLRAALIAYQQLPPLPDPAEPIRAEARIIENTFVLPHSELVEQSQAALKMDKLWVDLATTPWELRRAREAFRLLLASMVEGASLDAWHSGRYSPWNVGGWYKLRLSSDPASAIVAPATLEELFQSTPAVKHFMPAVDTYLHRNDRLEVARRALVFILALRTWQSRHEGYLPKSLDELKGMQELTLFLTDPFTPGHPFGYIRSDGQPLLPLGNRRIISEVVDTYRSLVPMSDCWLLYSVGADLRDQRARENERATSAQGDIIFPLKDNVHPNKPGDKKQGDAAARPESTGTASPPPRP